MDWKSCFAPSRDVSEIQKEAICTPSRGHPWPTGRMKAIMPFPGSTHERRFPAGLSLKSSPGNRVQPGEENGPLSDSGLISAECSQRRMVPHSHSESAVSGFTWIGDSVKRLASQATSRRGTSVGPTPMKMNETEWRRKRKRQGFPIA